MTDIPIDPVAFPSIQGRCPACGGQSLFVGSGGWLTCSRLECPEPDAASTLLERKPAPAEHCGDTQIHPSHKAMRGVVVFRCPGTKPPTPERREQVAAAIEHALLPVMPRRDHRKQAANQATDAALAVRDQRVEQLRAEVRRQIDAKVGIGRLLSRFQAQAAAVRDVLRQHGIDLDDDPAATIRDTIAVLKARAQVAEAELATLREGEEPHADEAAIATPAQWIWLWNRATPERRLEVAEQIQESAARADRCFMGNHEGRLADIEPAIARVHAYLISLCAEPHPSHDHVCPDDVRRDVLAALDQPPTV